MPRTVEWLNANAYRTYPLVEDQQLVMSGGEKLDKGALLDIRGVCYVHAQTKVHLESVLIVVPAMGPNTATFRFVYEGAVSDQYFDVSVPENAAFPFASTVHNSSVHHITVTFGEKVVAFMQNPAGIYTFATPVQVEPALVNFQNEHRVSSIQATGVAGYEDVLTGIIHVKEGYNCQVTVLPDTDVLRISGIIGAGRGISCETLDPAILLCPETLLRLNGLRAGDLGEFIVKGEDGVTLVPDPDNHSITISATKSYQDLECG
jgi:hypothetical protein